VHLPAGYRTTRREVLKLLPLAGGVGCIYVAVTRAKVRPSFPLLVCCPCFQSSSARARGWGWCFA
jgi:hypothetical protein